MQTVLITGAAGRLGGNLTPRILDRGYRVRALVLPGDPKAGKLDGLDVEIVEGDLTDPALCARVVDGVDAVVHTANILGPPPGMDAETFHRINVGGTFHLLEAVAPRADRLERFVHVSSDAVYPTGNHETPALYAPIDEHHPKRPVGLYAGLKLVNEVMVETYGRTHSLRTSLVRPSGMFAGKEILNRWSVSFVAARIRRAAALPDSGLHHPEGEAIADDLLARAESPDQLCAVRSDEGQPWLYSPADARDVADACVCALEHPAAVGEAFNATIPHPLAYPDVAEFLARRTGATVLEAEVPMRWVYWLDVGKARATIGYRPQGDVERIFETALADEAGEPTDVVPA